MASTRLSDTDRIEGFSDALFAIAITLLALDLATPEPGRFLPGLLEGWPSYLAYLTAFVTIAAVWVHHHTVFTRVGSARPSIVILNLPVLLGVSLLPWPTRLIGTSLADGVHDDQVGAVTTFGLVSLILSIGWIPLSVGLARHPELLERPTDLPFIRANARRAWLTLIPTCLALVLGLFVPIAALLVYLAIAVAFLVMSARSGVVSEPDTA